MYCHGVVDGRPCMRLAGHDGDCDPSDPGPTGPVFWSDLERVHPSIPPHRPRTIVDVLSDLDLDPFPYSGRGMLGRRCLAVRSETDAAGTLSAIVAAVLKAAATLEEAREALMPLLEARVQEDQLGHATVVYWPTLAPAAE